MKDKMNADVIKQICSQIDFTRPFNIFDVADGAKDIFVFDAVEEEKKFRVRKVREIIAGIKDAEGKRKCFAVSGRRGNYINVECAQDVNELKEIQLRLKKQRRGLSRSIKKIDERKKQLEGQISMFDRPADGRRAAL